MNGLSELKAAAEETAVARGHRLSWFPPFQRGKSFKRNGFCLDCQASVHLDTNPMPNGIDIGGSALAINCEKGGK